MSLKVWCLRVVVNCNQNLRSLPRGWSHLSIYLVQVAAVEKDKVSHIFAFYNKISVLLNCSKFSDE